MHIRTIIFDLGNVLVESDRDKFYDGISKYSRNGFSKHAHFGLNGYESLYESGLIGSQEFFEKVKKRYHLALDYSTFYKLWNSSIKEMPESEDLVYRLNNLGYALVALSNTNSEHIHYINSKSNLLYYFDYKVFSHIIGTTKPDERMYREALKLSKSTPAVSLFIDDKEENIKAAIRLGIKSILHKSIANTTRELEKLNIL